MDTETACCVTFHQKYVNRIQKSKNFVAVHKNACCCTKVQEALGIICTWWLLYRSQVDRNKHDSGRLKETGSNSAQVLITTQVN